MSLRTVCVSFPTRESRTAFVAGRLGKYLRGSVLDVGCFEAPLRDMPGHAAYTGIDFAGKPDVKLNLEEVTRLPFDDNAFQCVICIDVLEHLDNLHAIFGELTKVSKNHIIVSLPNC